MDKLYSLEEADSLAKHPGTYCEGCNGYDMTKRFAAQLADTMRENERLREALKTALDAMLEVDKTGDYLFSAEIYDAREALKPYKESGNE